MTKKIRILEAIRQGQFGGGESHVLDLVTHIDRDKYEPVVLSFTEGAMVDKLRLLGIATYVIPTTKAFSVSVWKDVLQLLKDQKIDIVHAHGTRANSNVFWAAKKLGLPLIYTVHGWSFHQDQRFPVRQLREYFERYLTHKADQVVCVSKSNELDGLMHCKLNHSTVIYNAVNLERFNPNNRFKNIRKELDIAQEAVVIGYIVRMTHQKDPFTMIHAMKRVVSDHPLTVLLMVGDGELKKDCIKLTNELGLMDSIIFQPFRSDIPDILNAIDIYCLPSLWEGFPIGILEAMAMQKAIVATPVDGTAELITNGETGLLVNHSNPEELAGGLSLLISDVELRHELAKNGRSYVVENFGIERLVEEVEELYSSFA